MMPTVSDDQTLVGRATDAYVRYRSGERDAFDELVGVMTPLLWRTARGAGLDAGAAEDVVQTVWLGLLRSGDSLRDPRTIVKWLLTSCRRESWRVRRSVSIQTQRTSPVFDAHDEELTALPAQRDALPEEQVLADDRQRVLWGHVRELTVRCRQLLGVIAFADRPDYALIAESLGMPVGSIGPTRGRCLGKLREVLAHDPLWEGLEP